MSQVSQTAGEVMDSVDGHEEMAVAQHFGRTVFDLTDDPFMLGRALVFVTRRRLPDVNDDDARNFALAMPRKELETGYFADESEADEAAGKDEPASEPPPPSLLPSAL